MKAFYILKPDALERKEVLYYYKYLFGKLPFVKNREQYTISSWIELSKILYDPIDKQVSLEECINIRKKMLTTIKGYDILYPDDKAIIDIFDIPENDIFLKKLEQIKYQIRKDFVVNTPKNYIKFLNIAKYDLSIELKNIPVKELEVLHKRVNYNEEINEQGYNLAFLNCIHFPDPNYEYLERDLEIIESSKILTKKIKL